MKRRIAFRFTYNLEKKDERLPLEVSGIGYEYTTIPYTDIRNRYDADIDFIMYKGQNIVEVIMMLEDIWDEMICAAIMEAARTFESQKEVV